MLCVKQQRAPHTGRGGRLNSTRASLLVKATAKCWTHPKYKHLAGTDLTWLRNMHVNTGTISSPHSISTEQTVNKSLSCSLEKRSQPKPPMQKGKYLDNLFKGQSSTPSLRFPFYSTGSQGGVCYCTKTNLCPCWNCFQAVSPHLLSTLH